MKKILILIFAMALSFISFAQKQNEVRGSMGIDFISVPSLKEYIDQLPYEQLTDFNSAVNFSGSYGRMLSESFQLQAELGYLLYSFTSSDIDGQYELAYNLIMPSVLAYYVINGTGYNFKFGGGAGVRFLSVEESLPGTGSSEEYSSIGYGFILRAEGNTAIAEEVYAYIGADARYDVNGEPANDGENLYNVVYKENVNFNSLSFGIRLGISYQF
ncbi:MAG: hypothetical protein MUF28_01270 [Ignavibacterium sp.]|jgi:hypothetical protein|nr:hypothetical protein [Ignavibacterium sp.]